MRLLRDEHGEEMHKSKGNAIWFEDAAEKMGVDVMRWMYMRHAAGQQPQLRLRGGG
jgi:isoleucyl-tRNA synthetase